MWRDDLRLLGGMLAIALRRLTCRCRGGALLEIDGTWLGVEPAGEWLAVRCTRCGFLSPGLVNDTRAVRRQWRYDRQRVRFRRAS
jgi:hypothetical protein